MSDPDTIQPYEDQPKYDEPVKTEEQEDKLDDGIRQILRGRFSFEEDEMSTLFPTREALRAFYQDSLKVKKVKSQPDDDKEPEDSFEGTTEQQRDFEEHRSQRAKNAKRLEELRLKRGDSMLQKALPEYSENQTDEPTGPKKKLKDLIDQDLNLDENPPKEDRNPPAQS